MSPRRPAQPDEYTAAVAAAIQAVRASLGLSVAELARRSGIVGITLHRVLHSQRP